MLARLPLITAPAPRLYSKAEVARMLGCSQRTVDVWRAAGMIRAVPVGRLVKFSPAEVERLISEGIDPRRGREGVAP